MRVKVAGDGNEVAEVGWDFCDCGAEFDIYLYLCGA